MSPTEIGIYFRHLLSLF